MPIDQINTYESAATQKMILVLGTSRGGTTLLSSSLGAHPDIAMLDEDMNGAICNITGGKIPANKLCVPNQIDFEKKWNPIFALGLSNGFFRKTLFMNKIPKGIYNLQDYNKFGDMHFIGILRHPAGVLSSIQKRENKSLDVACYRWQRCLEVFETLKNQDGFNFNILSFESLVENPVGHLKELSDWLGVSYNPVMMEGPKSNKRYSYDKGFDPSKTDYQNSDDVWRYFSKDIQARYNRLLEFCIKPDAQQTAVGHL
ncbi:MAG: hypothetical protein AAF569_00415 [Pseudomonadota bacterium]